MQSHLKVFNAIAPKGAYYIFSFSNRVKAICKAYQLYGLTDEEIKKVEGRRNVMECSEGLQTRPKCI